MWFYNARLMEAACGTALRYLADVYCGGTQGSLAIHVSLDTSKPPRVGTAISGKPQVAFCGASQGFESLPAASLFCPGASGRFCRCRRYALPGCPAKAASTVMC